jgi:hypothetical protein
MGAMQKTSAIKTLIIKAFENDLVRGQKDVEARFGHTRKS